uniref:Uncharacterized protein n=1 Tax=Nelumbo nucifera TaxID=4432 RepID=A0A822XRH2_NELNU|nr:TPA_asm: hypothetical protein HUJ06_023204 [Nelumbo nucifera]
MVKSSLSYFPRTNSEPANPINDVRH